MNAPKQPNFTIFNRRDLSALVKVISPMAFVVIVSVYFHEFVLHAVAVNPAINMGILAAATFGVVLIIMRLVDAQKDFRIIERFGYEANQGVYMKTLLAQPWLKKRYVRHYLSHIANTGGTLSSQLEHSAIKSELHALESDYDSKLELPQFLVGFMIAMGLLGTFIGLLETLTGISGMLDGLTNSGEDVQKQFMKLVVELRRPLAGMGIAFSASMFGLITSLMLAIMMTNLRRYISRVISLARNVMHELTEMGHEQSNRAFGGSLSPTEIDNLLLENEPAHPAAPALLSPEQGGGYIGGNIDPVFSGRFEVLTRKIEMLLEVFVANTETTRRLNDLIGFGPRMKEISEKTLEEIKTMSANNLEQQRLLRSLVSGNGDVVRALAGILEAQKQAGDDVSDQIRKLGGHVVDMRDAGISNGGHLNEIKENFTKLSQSSGVVDLIATSVGGQTALLQSLIEEVRRSQQGLAAINRSILGG